MAAITSDSAVCRLNHNCKKLYITVTAWWLVAVLQKRLTNAAKKAVNKMPQKTLRRGDAVSIMFSCSSGFITIFAFSSQITLLP